MDQLILHQAKPVSFTYTNWRGETDQREAILLELYYGSTEWHPTPQYLVRAYDLEKKAERLFALKDMRFDPCPYL